MMMKDQKKNEGEKENLRKEVRNLYILGAVLVLYVISIIQKWA
jgi:hypothetical protein